MVNEFDWSGTNIFLCDFQGFFTAVSSMTTDGSEKLISLWKLEENGAYSTVVRASGGCAFSAPERKRLIPASLLWYRDWVGRDLTASGYICDANVGIWIGWLVFIIIITGYLVPRPICHWNHNQRLAYTYFTVCMHVWCHLICDTLQCYE